ncbi:amino acid adenylation domain-containing protein [Kitasatospora sp. DSM 101779]|uniref:amino acid adenylation domain-containing protein n=1 Tax=Kitasatospora sp. DSM 101779 TaxID=2853165 RepID=UPI0021DB7869|nr:amino acid adenylation domain-containing protein [Kitasatospora sp. DSM 101779]MCU7826087.1 amino acid adenylation domain-containing protein [Kitasatospora sp. DSM 101779]
MVHDPAEAPPDARTAGVRSLLARRLRGAAGGPAAEDRITPRPDRDAPAPLSAAQRRLWLVEQLYPGTAAYNVSTAFRLRGPLDTAVLRRSLDTLLGRHESLRTAFRTTADGTPVQCPRPATRLALPVAELTPGRDEQETLDSARSLLTDDCAVPFDLGAGPLLRAGLLRLAEEDHVLALTVHHLVADHWTLAVLCEELSAIYPALLRGEPSPLPEPPLQYADFASWEAQRGTTGDGASLDWWTERLAGLAPLELPTDRPRPAVRAFTGARVSAVLPAAATAALRTAAKDEGATLFMAVLAGLQAVLARWTGSTDIAVGGAMAGRDRPELERLAGFFVDLLPLRGDLSGDPSFAELLGRTRESVLAAADHRDVPFDRLVEAAAPARDLSRPPLVSVALSYLSTPPPRLALGPAEASEFPFDPGAARFDLDLFARELPDGALGLELDHRTDLFDRGTAERLLAGLTALLTAAADDPGSPLSALTAPGDAETAELAALGSSPVPHPTAPLVHELVARHAAADPGRPAVVHGARTVGYGELDAHADRLARRLVRRGVGPGTLVGVCLERSPELVGALLAVLRAGGAYLPLDPEYPADRLAHMLADSGTPLVVTDAHCAGRLPASAAALLLADAEDPADPEDPAETEAPADTEDPAETSAGPGGRPVAADDLAYAIYTSGSTGRPKGVLVEHRALLNLCHWHNRRHRITPEDRGTMLAAQGFDAAVWELWPYLAAGASVAVVDAAVRTDPAGLTAWLADSGATVAFLPTPLAEAVLAEEGCARLPLRSLLTGGELLRRRPRPGLPFTVVNHYGPTENAVVATEGEVAPEGVGEGPADIGRPIDNVLARVLASDGTPVPRGAVGELYLGGAGLARGYLGAEALTRQRFVPDPQGPPGARLYRTGDLVRWRTDGRLDFLGRADRQVKVRGHRIEPGEIEARLVEHQGIAEAVVVLHSPAGGEAALVGYLTLPGRGTTAPEGLREWLAERLPEPMLPAGFVVLDALPLTPAGKIDRAALPDPGALRPPFRAPRPGTEARLAALWAQVFGLPEVGADDDFFALGGHSLLATRLLGRVRRAFAVEVPLHALFRFPTVARLAAGAVDPALAAAQEETDRRLRARMAALSEEQIRALIAHAATSTENTAATSAEGTAATATTEETR